MTTFLYERYISLRSDVKSPGSYGAVSSRAKTKPSVGTTLSKAPGFPYDEPAKEINDEDGEDISLKLKKKINIKIGGPAHKNDPFSSNWVDRGAFVNWATRLDLYEQNKKVKLNDIVKGLSGNTSLGGTSKFSAMGNGAGIYKTRSGKTIGMNIGGKAQTFASKKTNKRIPPSLVDFIKLYAEEDGKEI